MRNVGTVVRGIRTPIIKSGDNLVDIVVDSLLKASRSEKFDFYDRDIIGVTEAVVSICENNYATIDQIAVDVKNKYPSKEVGIVFPTPLSRNRFAQILQGVARGVDKIYMLIRYPDDEVGNSLFDHNLLKKYNLNPSIDTLNEKQYNSYFGNEKHMFTGVNYIEYFKELITKENCEVEFIFSSNPKEILNYTKNILIASVHTREEYRELLKRESDILYTTGDILKESVNGSGYNSKYGLLGSNKATDETLKLFPETGDEFVLKVQEKMFEVTGKRIEVLVYGDGAFKDPVGHIWELSDPVVSPAFTDGLKGTPNELKLKYLSDNKFSELHGADLNEAIKKEIKEKEKDLKGSMASLGTTPRQISDLVGSLCDLTSGSGDKGTPVVFIQRYFDSYGD